MKLNARASATAIAAALALSSTPLIAQQAPAAAKPVPTDTPPPPATTDSAPPAVTTDTTTAAPDTSTTSTTPTDATTTAKPKPKRTVTRVKTAAVAAPVRTVHRSVTTQTAHVAATGAAAPVAAQKALTPTPPAAPPVSQSAVKPIVDTTAAPPPAQTVARPAPSRPDNTEIELGAGALALIALGGGAWALSRRKRSHEEFVDETYEPAQMAEAEPIAPAAAAPIHAEQPAILAPSAFAWGDRKPEASVSDDGSDRRAGESWVERAYRGPSPANPSVSLRARLKRAAFFDKREREVAAGTAEPVETDAGLPEAMVDERERELA